MAHMMLSNARATRGKRMSVLVGKAAEDDEAFWGAGAEVWDDDEGSDAAAYVAEEEKPDLFDSDFNDTETEEERIRMLPLHLFPGRNVNLVVPRNL